MSYWCCKCYNTYQDIAAVVNQLCACYTCSYSIVYLQTQRRQVCFASEFVPSLQYEIARLESFVVGHLSAMVTVYVAINSLHCHLSLLPYSTPGLVKESHTT